MSKDPLADLGLDTVAPTTVATKAKADVKKSSKAGTKDVPVETTTTTTASHEEVEVGELEFETIDFIPTAKRTAGGSKYKFDDLKAPVAKDPKTGKPAWDSFVVRVQEGVDADKLKRSVQSATTQANKQNAGAGKYFISRSIVKDGALIAMRVIRTDYRPDGE